MLTREALEAALQTGWNADELEVYADLLLADGDPRGELIALDRRPAPDDAAWRDRRKAALERWLGAELAARAGHLVQHGFIHELRSSGHALELLDGELGFLVRGYTVWGMHPRVGDALARIAAKPRPWLKRLAIAYWGMRPYGLDLWRMLAAATPNLEELHLIGRPAFTAIAHPNVKRIVVDQTMSVELPDVARERRTSREWSTGWPITSDDLALIKETVAGLADCNLLYDWYAEAFSEPMPALLARVAAAGVIELDGPIARPPRGYQLRDTYADIYHDRNLYIDVGVTPEANLGMLQAHVNHVVNCLYETTMPQPLRVALNEYIGLLNGLGYYVPPPQESRKRVLKSMVPSLALAFELLLERRALLDEPRTPGFITLETLASLLARPGAHRRVVLRT